MLKSSKKSDSLHLSSNSGYEPISPPLTASPPYFPSTGNTPPSPPVRAQRKTSSLEGNTLRYKQDVTSDNKTTLSRTSSRANSEKTGSIRTSTQMAMDYANQNTSKYSKVSYHLTHDPTAIKRYREMAEKTRDTTTQLVFAKYLLETANAFYPNNDVNAPPKIVGSMWGVGTKDAQRPEPFIVVPVPEDALSSNSISNSGTYSTQLTTATTIVLKQQAYINTNHPKIAPVGVNEPQLKKRKVLEDEGIKWTKRLAKAQVPEACYMEARWMDLEVYGFKKNKARSFELHLIAAKAGIPESMFAAAKHLEKENQEPATVLKYYRASADKGYVDAVYKMATLVLQGKLGLKQSLVEGLKLMHKACTLCNQDFHEPLYTFALMLTNDYPQTDFPSALTEPYGGKEAAILYLERAASFNNYDAQSRLGSIYEHGLYGESMNFARAFDYYEAAAMNGNPKAMLGLCRLNNRGSHGPGDKDEGERLENDVSGWLAATPVNEDLAFSWCEKAAEANLPDAFALLGWFYESGFGTPRDFSKAEEYYQLAAKAGDKSARSRLQDTNKSITKQQHE
ncbi:hypothetical protein CU098_000582, partial [Rhizopus stolonifer]